MSERYLRHGPVDSDSFPPGTPQETIDYWKQVFGEKKKTKKPSNITPDVQPNLPPTTSYDTIRYPCGCTMTVYLNSDGTIKKSFPHIQQGCQSDHQ
jgi:hypothetical protein